MTLLRYITLKNAEEWAGQFARFAQVFALHRQLRPAMENLDDYVAQMQRIFTDHTQMLLALDETNRLAALALYRVHHNTYQHKLFFLEDLVVDDARRDSGIGSTVLSHLEETARECGCRYLSLDSGTFRIRAHKFYHMHDYAVNSFHFVKEL